MSIKQMPLFITDTINIHNMDLKFCGVFLKSFSPIKIMALALTT